MATELAQAMTEGIQNRGTGACLKHFYANNQETRRVSNSSEAEERTLREIYLAAFEGAVKKGRPCAVMCSYNKINGTYAAADRRALTDILRTEWGFTGFVMSDWGAVDDRVKDIKAGLDLKMPYSGGIYDGEMLAAIEDKSLPEEILDLSVERILKVVFALKEKQKESICSNEVLNHVIAAKLAEETAGKADIAVIFAGLPESMESEGYDRVHMRLPECQNLLIWRVAEVQKNTVVVLHNGSPVEMPWIEKVSAVLETYLSGEGTGRAAIRILTGEANPSGRLPETFPLRLEHNPSYLNFPGEGDITKYQEGIFVGYRYYETRKLSVLFPFGYGLSYTCFSYSGLKLNKDKMSESESLIVRFALPIPGTGKGKKWCRSMWRVKSLSSSGR